MEGFPQAHEWVEGWFSRSFCRRSVRRGWRREGQRHSTPRRPRWFLEARDDLAGVGEPVPHEGARLGAEKVNEDDTDLLAVSQAPEVIAQLFLTAPRHDVKDPLVAQIVEGGGKSHAAMVRRSSMPKMTQGCQSGGANAFMVVSINALSPGFSASTPRTQARRLGHKNLSAVPT